MKKICNINFMKYFKFFFILFICSFLTNNAYADCDAGVNFGDDLRKTQKKRLGKTMPSRASRNVVHIFLSPYKHCPEENLGKTFVKLAFENEKLYSKTIQVVNLSKENLESKKKLLFNYVIRNYGNFKGSENIDESDILNHWKINGIDVVYIKELNPNGFMREELTLFNTKYKSKNNIDE